MVSTSVRLFAEDCVIDCRISNLSELNLTILEDCLYGIAFGCSIWLIAFNISKCMYARLSDPNSDNSCPSAYTLNNNTIEAVSPCKCLGVCVATDISWNKHTDHVLSNTNRSLVNFLNEILTMHHRLFNE